ncbi:MAG: hypothetical protein V1802_01040 [Candidatus Aenigmatarchaeota archaeon]
MAIENEMRSEIRKLEKEISFLDDELEKLHNKIVQLIMLRRKKEHDLRVLKANFEEPSAIDEREVQTTLARLLKEKI